MRKIQHILLFTLAAVVAAAQPLESLLNEAGSVRNISRTAISPDGKSVVWVEELGPKWTAIYLGKPGSAPQRITAGKGPFNEPEAAWCGDSERIAFLSDAQTKGQLNVFIATGNSGIRRVSSLKGFVTEPRWSPDCSQLSILYTENAAKEGGALGPTAREVGVIEAKIDEQRIALINPGTSAVKLVSPGDLYVYEYDWSPDGRQFAAIAAKGSGDNNWFIAHLSTIDAKSGEETVILQPGMQIAVPRWSPDGRSIAFIGGLMSDAGVVGGDIYKIDPSGGKAVNLTPGMKLSASGLQWMLSSKRIVFTAALDGGSAIAGLDIASGQIETEWKSPETIKAAGDSPLSLSTDGTSSAMIRTSWEHPPEVWSGPIGAHQGVSHPLAKAKIHVELAAMM
ncbi:MAG: S9 family peptidase, partial [Bryobacteraceae bacterium]